MFSRIAAIVCAAIALPALAASPKELTLDKDKPYVHAPSKFIFPTAVGRFERHAGYRYDIDGQNISIGYDRGDLRMSATVYVYPTNNEDAAEHFARVVADVLRAFKGMEVVDQTKTTIKQGDREWSAHMAASLSRRGSRIGDFCRDTEIAMPAAAS